MSDRALGITLIVTIALWILTFIAGIRMENAEERRMLKLEQKVRMLEAINE